MDTRGPVTRFPALTVLLVEDNDLGRIYLEHLLHGKGHVTVPAATGREALDAVARQPFDLILMDLQLPDMDGLAVAKAIRSGAGGPATPPDIPILALTADAAPADRERCLAAGMTGHVAKPFRGPELFAAISRALAAPEGTDAPACLDLDALAGGCRQEVTARMLGLFLQLAEPRGRNLAAAIERGDLPAAQALAHDLAGMAGPIRAPRLGETMRSLQQACAAGDMAGCREGLARAGRELARVVAAVRAHPWLAGTPRPHQ